MNRTNTNQMRVAIYARVSSERQAEKELSIPAQLKALKKYALGRGWDVAAEYVDEAENARSANRPAFKDMIAATKNRVKPFDAILVWKLSRFARNREDSVIYKSLLKRRKISVVSMNEQVDESPAGSLLEGIASLPRHHQGNEGKRIEGSPQRRRHSLWLQALLDYTRGNGKSDTGP